MFKILAEIMRYTSLRFFVADNKDNKCLADTLPDSSGPIRQRRVHGRVLAIISSSAAPP